MPLSRPGGSTGSLTITGHNGDFASFSARFSQPVDSSANYGDVLFESHNGAGILAMNLDAAGFMKAGAANSSPHPEAISATGANATLQFSSNCTIIGAVILSDMTLGHSRKSGVAPMSISGVNAGNLTVAWQET